MGIEIANESGENTDADSILAVARYTLDELNVNPLADLSILIVESTYMAELNKRWMNKTGPTDVLAFPMDELGIDSGPIQAGRDAPEEPALLGDIVLCPEVAARQAKAAGHLPEDELALLTVHGVLHLLGYDHAEPDEEREMFALQGRLLKAWRASQGITREMRIPATSGDLPEIYGTEVSPEMTSRNEAQTKPNPPKSDS
ncbi:MAG: rRNA maturation RNase YbeY [Corynebacteriales bacterium]|nr:rRNA maturation RNase YbeY [Mycobacteriales bacterium]